METCFLAKGNLTSKAIRVFHFIIFIILNLTFLQQRPKNYRQTIQLRDTVEQKNV